MPSRTPSLSDLYDLAEQLELDKDLPVAQARARDHAIAADCDRRDDTGRLLCWLGRVSSQRSTEPDSRDPWLTEASLAYLGGILAFVFGCAGMATFLLASANGLVNVFMFLLLFVVVQLLLCLVAAVVMWRTIRGNQPLVLPVNPARLLVSRLFPDKRYLREAQSVVRLVFLRYGQEFGAIFTLGAIAAFFVVLALSHFTFVWGSTFELSDGFVERMTTVVASPWSAVLPEATVAAQLIADTRFHPAISQLSPEKIDSMRGWWPFLIMATITYALLPRLLLWLCSRIFYTRHMRSAFTGFPGSERVLARMKAPLVRTQGEGGGDIPAVRAAPCATDEHLLLLNWANALTPEDAGRFDAFAAVADGSIVNAGLGSLPEELERLGGKLSKRVEHLYVAVKSWEPPMADLADFLANFTAIRRCTLFLVPLAHKPVTVARLDDWQAFARGLEFALVDVQVLDRENTQREVGQLGSDGMSAL